MSATFSQGVGEVLDEILKVFNTFRCFLWNIEDVQKATIFDRFFWGCQHGVDERVSVRGAVTRVNALFISGIKKIA